MNPTRLSFRLAPALLAAALACTGPRPARADVPPVPAPPRADSLAKIDSKPAPLLLPGRPNPADAERLTREQEARQKYGLGLGLEEQGAGGAAIIAYEQAIKLDPKLRGPREHIGRLYAAVGRHDAAVKEFMAEVMLDPGNRRVARELGVALANAGDSTNAIRQLRLLVGRDTRDTASWRALGFAYGLANRPADAEQALRRAIDLDRHDAGAWRDLGLVLALRGRTSDARDAYNRAADLDPDDGGAMLNLGNLEWREGRRSEALEAYRESERRDSTLDAAYEGQIKVLRALDRDPEAGEVYRRWLVLRPRESGVRLAAIRLFDSIDRSDIALELARDGVRVDPRSSQAHITLGMALDATGDVAGMLVELRKAQRYSKDVGRIEKIESTIASLRAKAPDSLRAVYAADSLAHPALPAPADRDSTAER